MYIADIIWLPQIIGKLAWKHDVFPEEVGQVLFSRAVIEKFRKAIFLVKIFTRH